MPFTNRTERPVQGRPRAEPTLDDGARQQALLRTGALQAAIFNSAYFAGIATDEAGVIQIFNVGAERMLGYQAADVIDRITPADVSDPAELIARAAALSREHAMPIARGFEALIFKASRGIEDIYEMTYVRKDGSRLPAIVSVTALRDATDQVIGYLLIGTDNTARKQADAAQALLDQQLRDQQFYTRSLIESHIDALVTTDPQGVITDVNQQMMSLTGRARAELIGAPWRVVFTNPAMADVAIARVLAENSIDDFELTVCAKDGRKTVVSCNAATFLDRDLQLKGVFASARDITDRKQFERELQEKNIALVHASRMKSEFLATMSHELRTPLNSIIGFSEALKDGLVGDMSASQTEYIGDIFTSGQHLLALINDILDLSKVEAGMMTLELETGDLNTLLSNSLSIVRDKAALQQVRLVLELGTGLDNAELDVRKTKQIVYNLLSNAVKFSPKGGCVTLSARRVTRAQVCRLKGPWPAFCFPLVESAHQEFVEISVSDNGIGISRSNMGKLFQAFSQIDSSLARKFEGTGLGLAMVRQLAELHGGSVGLASEAGEGARFVAWLPLRAAVEISAQMPQAPAPAGQAAPEAPSALVIEDDDRTAELIRVLLEAEGFQVARAATGAAALALVHDQGFNVITLDIQLPDSDGWALLERLRAAGALADAPVIVISNLIDRTDTLHDGVAAVLQKPVSRAQLKTSLAALGLLPSALHTHTILVVDEDARTANSIAALLPVQSFAVARASGGSESIALTIAEQLLPDLIMVDVAKPDAMGLAVVDALHHNRETAHIPVLLVATHGDEIVLAAKPDPAEPQLRDAPAPAVGVPAAPAIINPAKG